MANTRDTDSSTQSTNLPAWLTGESVFDDDLPTESSELLLETAEVCLPLLIEGFNENKINRHGLLHLDRAQHVKFLHKSLGRLPAPFVGLDASRPWMLYWCLMALNSLGEDPSKYCGALISTLKPIQNLSGGFGGGNGQYSHLATTYAGILSLATVGGQEAYDLIDRQAMWRWLGRLKQPSGEFEVCEGGEKDVRGALCAMVIISLLDLPIDLPQDSPARTKGDETLLTGLAEWISACQTYEGGLGSTPGAEAHGAYTFCGLACLCILGEPRNMFARYLDVSDLLRWLTARQHAPEGGLAGRTNKLVDNCYSHWIGGCWSLVEAAIGIPSTVESSIPRSLFNREALARYILCCGQAERGGLRDKPGKPPDAYHTQYGLAGLSSAQNNYQYIPGEKEKNTASFSAAFEWRASTGLPGMSTDESTESKIFGDENRASLLHPIYVIPWESAEKMRSYFCDKPMI